MKNMDNMKHSFAEKIKQSSHFLINPGHSNSIIPMKNQKRTKKGWAIPRRKKFHYSEKQKSILMKYYEEGEQTGI